MSHSQLQMTVSARYMLIKTSSLVIKYYACGRSTIRYPVTVGRLPIVLP